MSISPTEDIKSITELKKKTSDIFKQLHRTGRPVIIMVNGKADAVLMDVAVYEKKLQALNLGVLLAEAEKDVAEGNVRSARSFIEDVKLDIKV